MHNHHQHRDDHDAGSAFIRGVIHSSPASGRSLMDGCAFGRQTGAPERLVGRFIKPAIHPAGRFNFVTRAGVGAVAAASVARLPVHIRRFRAYQGHERAVRHVERVLSNRSSSAGSRNASNGVQIIGKAVQIGAA